MCKYCDNYADNDCIEYEDNDGSYTSVDIEHMDGKWWMFTLVHEEGGDNHCGVIPISHCPMCSNEL